MSMYSNPRKFFYPAAQAGLIASTQAVTSGIPLQLNKVVSPDQFTPYDDGIATMQQGYRSFQGSAYPPGNNTILFGDMARRLLIDASAMTQNGNVVLLGANEYGQEIIETVAITSATANIPTTNYYTRVNLALPNTFPASSGNISIGTSPFGQTRFVQMDVTYGYWNASVEVFVSQTPAPAGWSYSIFSTNAQISAPSGTHPGQMEVTTGSQYYARPILATQTTSSWTALPNPFTTLWVNCQPSTTPADYTANAEFTVYLVQQGH